MLNRIFLPPGKNASNRVGGTIKRLAAHVSLQCPFPNQIFKPNPHPKAIISFCLSQFWWCHLAFLWALKRLLATLDFLSRNLLHQTHLSKHRVTINSFPPLQALVLQWRRHHMQHTQKKSAWLGVLAVMCKQQLKILSLESSMCANMTMIGISVLRTSCQVSMVM